MPNEIAKRLKHFRAIKGWTQKELAEKAGVSQAHISAIEVGNKEPSVQMLRTLADVFGIPVDMFLRDNYVPLADLKLPPELAQYVDEQTYLAYVELIKDATAHDITPEMLRRLMEALYEVKARDEKTCRRLSSS